MLYPFETGREKNKKKERDTGNGKRGMLPKREWEGVGRGRGRSLFHVCLSLAFTMKNDKLQQEGEKKKN